MISITFYKDYLTHVTWSFVNSLKDLLNAYYSLSKIYAEKYLWYQIDKLDGEHSEKLIELLRHGGIDIDE